MWQHFLGPCRRFSALLFRLYSLKLTLTSIKPIPGLPAGRSDCADAAGIFGDRMTDLSVTQNLAAWKPANKVRFVTAASLFYWAMRPSFYQNCPVLPSHE